MSGNTDIELSTYRLIIFTDDRMYYLCGKSDIELDPWKIALSQLIKDNLIQEEINTRETCAKELIKILDAQYHQELIKAEELLRCLQDHGLASAPSKPRKMGYLWMLSDKLPGVWKKCYCTLKTRFLGYQIKEKVVQGFESEKGKEKTEPVMETNGRKGVIALKYAKLILHNPKEKEKEPINEETFGLQTPYITYFFKAKHKEALLEWITTISACIIKKGKQKHNTPFKEEQVSLLSSAEPSEPTSVYSISPISNNSPISRSANDSIDQETELAMKLSIKPYSKPTLSWLENGKSRTHKLSNSKTVIGRSSSSNLRINDKTISRQHCRIDKGSDEICVFIDLGSSHGTKVNKVLCNRKYLIPGDTMLIGQTTITFNATDKRG